MENRNLLAKELKKDANKTWKYLTHYMNNADWEYYFSPLYVQRKLKSLQKKYTSTITQKTEQLQKQSSKEKILRTKQNYQSQYRAQSQKTKQKSFFRLSFFNNKKSTSKTHSSSKDWGYYFSSLFFKRKVNHLKKDYLSNINLLETISKDNIKQRLTQIKHNHKRLGKIKERIENGFAYCSSACVSYMVLSFFLSSEAPKEEQIKIADLYAKTEIKKQKQDALIDERQEARQRQKIEHHKEQYHKENDAKSSMILSPFYNNDEIRINLVETRNIYASNQVDIEQNIKTRYEEIIDDQKASQVSLKDLLLKGEVSHFELQSAINRNPSILSKLKPGKTNIRLASSADKVPNLGRPRGRCLEGVQKIFEGAQYGNLIARGSPNWPERIKKCNDNSACNAYVPLAKNGDFVVLSVENKAYKKHVGSPENKVMRAFTKTLPVGTVVITDNVIPDEEKAHSYYKLRAKYGRGGKLHGHIAVADNSHMYRSDGTEPNGPNFSRYGQIIRIPLPQDIMIPKEQVIEILRESEKIRQAEREAISQTFIPSYMPYMKYSERG